MGKIDKNREFNASAVKMDEEAMYYYNRLNELAISSFKWDNLPDNWNARYLETQLFLNGSAIAFKDEVMGVIALSFTYAGKLDVYGEPIKRIAYSKYNTYRKELNRNNSVICWNNEVRLPSSPTCQYYAQRIYNLDRIIDTNANMQKSTVLLQGTEKQQLTLKNLYMQWDGLYPMIMADNNVDLNGLNVLKTDAPYVGDVLYQLKSDIWSEALNALGITNIAEMKKERMVVDEVYRMQGGAMASRRSRLEERQRFADKVNEMFGTNITVEFWEGDDITEGPDDVGEDGQDMESVSANKKLSDVTKSNRNKF